MPHSHLERHPARPCPRRRLLGLLILIAPACLCLQSGCINVFAMAGKMLMGDPKVTSTFEQRTGINLSEEEKTCVVACNVPASVMSEFDGLSLDLQGEIMRRMTLHGVATVDQDDVAAALDESGGRFDPVKLARKFPEVDYIFQIDIERFSLLEDGSTNLFRGRTSGHITGYEARGNGTDVPRHVSTVFEMEFNDEYPRSHPTPSDQTRAKVFERRFVNDLAGVIGRTFYDVPTSEAL